MFAPVLRRSPLAALILGAPLCAVAAADTLHVPSQHPNLRQALHAARDGDEIVVADGVYTGAQNKNLDFHGKRVVLRSENGPESCVIDCQGLGRGFHFHSGETPETVVDGLTIRNGYALCGAGILCVGSSPTIRRCVLTENTAHPGRHNGGGGMKNVRGSHPVVTDCLFLRNRQVTATEQPVGAGGMLNALGSSPIVTRCSFIENAAQQGGGFAAVEDSRPVLTSCRFRENYGDWHAGGAIIAFGSRVLFRDCSFVENSTGADGGGLGCHDGSTAVLVGCVFTGNHAGYMGGGMVNSDSDATLVDCTFQENTASPPDWGGGGGGMVSGGGTARLYNCLFSGNDGGSGEAGAFGGGGPGTRALLVNCTFAENVANGGGGVCVFNGATYRLANCVLWNNRAPAHGPQIAVIQGEDAFQPTSAIVSSSIVALGSSAVYLQNPAYELVWNADNLALDPLFADAAAGDFRPIAGSPCIDAGDELALPADEFDLDGDGDTSEPLPIDLDGGPRVDGTPPRLDLGAYELDPD